MKSYWHLKVGSKADGRGRRVLPMLLVACLAMFWIAGAQAVHDDGVFELDGNALNDPVAGQDWQNICPVATPPGDAACVGGSTAQASLFTTDGADASIFTQGGSKDDLDIPNWRHT